MVGERRPRLFTLAEARALLPALIPLLEHLQAQVRQARNDHAELERLAGSPHRGNGSRAADEARARELRSDIEALGREIQEQIREVESYGCELKDPEQGLIDFRSRREHRVVYLCWRLGEAEIGYWHELDTGFAGRQPLSEG